jgi:hypothetical protein
MDFVVFKVKMKSDYFQDFATNGYCVIKGVLPFELGCGEGDMLKEEIMTWINEVNPQYETHGCIKRHEVGQQTFMWNTRCRKEVQEPFKKLYGTEDLVTSFTGLGYFAKGVVKKAHFWMHTDQAPKFQEFRCIQSAVSLTSNKLNTFMCIPGSHLFHKKYFESKSVKDLGKNWQVLESPEDYERHTGQKYNEVVVPLEAGDMIMWDSRLFHQNRQGHDEERLVQYISFMPKRGRNPTQYAKRMKYFKTRRTTSHWSYPVHVNTLQTRHFGNPLKVINYDKLPKIKLEQYLKFSEFTMKDIYNLI